MNEAAVVLSLKDLIEQNRDTLTQGLVHQGVNREIRQITTSNLTPISSYYFILIYATDPGEKTNPTSARTTQSGRRMTRYPILIELADEAIYQVGDDEAYETMHNDFRTFCDRLVDLIEKQNFIGTEPKAKLERNLNNDRAIEKRNLSGTWEDTESNNWASLYAQLSFALVDECIDTSTLYG